MGRSNKNVRRKNSRLDRREKGAPAKSKIKPTMRVPVEEMVLPDGQCLFMNPRRPKARFATEEKAAEALRQAQRQRERIGSGHVEKRYYKCPEGGCGGFHLTSREKFDESIRQFRNEQYEQRSKQQRLAEDISW